MFYPIFRYKYIPYFSPTQTGRAVARTKVRIRKQTSLDDIFKGDYTDTSVITDDIAISSVRFTGKTSPAYVYFINYDELNTFMGVAVNAGGNFGPVWREAVTLTPEGASPASEYPF